MDAIHVENLTVRYGKVTAVDDISFTVKKGEIFGIIGPNGAGKTSTLECLEGLRTYKGGRIEVLGEDARMRDKLYDKVGIQLQETKFQDNIKVAELLGLYETFYEKPVNTDELLKNFDLFEQKNAFVKKLSGGERQKLAIILALVGNPDVLVLDEISTGLDPHARVQIWRKIKALNEAGKTILLTTHFMEEAQHLCDRVCLLVDGKIKASGTLEEVVALADLQIKITAYAPEAELKKLENVSTPTDINMQQFADHVCLTFTERLQIGKAMAWLSQHIQVQDMELYKPSLEDVFLKLTGAKLEGEQ